MKPFWKHTLIFLSVILIVAGIIIGVFYARGLVGGEWSVYEFSGENYTSLSKSDARKMKKLLEEINNTPATQEQIEEYTNATEWTGFIFSNDKTSTVYSFSNNLNILAVYQADKIAQTQSIDIESNPELAESQAEEIAKEVDVSDFSFYQCTKEEIEEIKAIYENYYE